MPAALLFGVVWAGFSAALYSASGATYIDLWNADLIQPYLMARSFVLDPSSLLLWWYSPANFIFPDVILASLLYVLVPWLAMPYVMGGLLLCLYTAGFAWLAREATGTRLELAMVLAAVLVAALGWAAISTSSDGALLMRYLAIPFVHTGALACGLLLVAVALPILCGEGGTVRLVASCVLACLAAASDLLSTLWFVVPVVALGLAAAIVMRSRRLAIRSIVLLGAALFGRLADLVFRGPRIPADYAASW